MANLPWRLYADKQAAPLIKAGDQRYMIIVETGIEPGDHVAIVTQEPCRPPVDLGIYAVLSSKPIRITHKAGALIVDGVTWDSSLIYQMAVTEGMPGIGPWLEHYHAMQKAADKAGAGLHMITWRYLVRTTCQLARPNRDPIPAGTYGMRIHTDPAKAKAYRRAGLVMIHFPIAGKLPIHKNAIEYAPANAGYTWPENGAKTEKENTHE